MNDDKEDGADDNDEDDGAIVNCQCTATLTKICHVAEYANPFEDQALTPLSERVRANFDALPPPDAT